MIASVARVATKANHRILSTSLKRATSLVESWPYLHFDESDRVGAACHDIDLAATDPVAAARI
jgi:hypothetical protein